MRSKVWFPGLHETVDHAMKECAACQSLNHTKRIEPLKMSEMPSKQTMDKLLTFAVHCQVVIIYLLSLLNTLDIQ
jgi:hypothetical protein